MTQRALIFILHFLDFSTLLIVELYSPTTKTKMPTTYSIEHAKSGRSSCKTKACGQKIEKGEVSRKFQ